MFFLIPKLQQSKNIPTLYIVKGKQSKLALTKFCDAAVRLIWVNCWNRLTKISPGIATAWSAPMENIVMQLHSSVHIEI